MKVVRTHAQAESKANGMHNEGWQMSLCRGHMCTVTDNRALCARLRLLDVATEVDNVWNAAASKHT